MQAGKYIYAIAIITALTACNNKNSDQKPRYDLTESLFRKGYKNGTYCAEIDYYYSETGSHTTYTFEVDIEENRLTYIHWPDGEWYDSSNFSSPDISDGEANFTSEMGAEYNIKIISREGECTLDKRTINEDETILLNEENEVSIPE